MCGLFGYSFYGEELKDLPRLIKILGWNTSVRGTDATGISYVMEKKLHIEKDGVRASEFKFPLPEDVNVCMGHVRKTTQGSEKKNYNNHPFRGKAKNCHFALAHNGVITNEKYLRNKYSLPKSQIETDTYIAVQLLEHFGTLDMESVGKMAEAVEGMYTFTLLDEFEQLWIVKNDSPITIAHFPKLKLYVYASTDYILLDSLTDWTKTQEEILDSFRYSEINMEIIDLLPGDIFVIKPDGTTAKGSFKPYKRIGYKDYSYYWGDYSYTNKKSSKKHKSTSSTVVNLPYVADYLIESGEDYYYELLVRECETHGVYEDDIILLLEYGYTLEDIEEALNSESLDSLLEELHDYLIFLEEKDKEKDEEKDEEKNKQLTALKLT